MRTPPDGSAQVTNIPDGTEGLVVVRGKDQNTTQVTPRPGERTSVQPDLPPSLPGVAPGLAFGQAADQGLGTSVQQEQQDRHRQDQERAQQQAEQARLGVLAAQAELARLTEQENALLTPTPTPKGIGPTNDAFAGATAVLSLPARFQQNTSGATTEGSEPTTACGPTSPVGKTSGSSSWPPRSAV